MDRSERDSSLASFSLPPGWKRFFDRSHQREYFHNAELRKTTWTVEDAVQITQLSNQLQRESSGAETAQLPDGWKRFFDTGHQREYYYSGKLRKTFS